MKRKTTTKPVKLFSVVLYSLIMKVWNCSLIDIVTLTKKSTENNFALVTLKIMTIKSCDEFGLRSTEIKLILYTHSLPVCWLLPVSI